MSPDRNQTRREKLLDRLAEGDIDQATYKELLAEIERSSSGTSQRESLRDTLGGVRTGAGLATLIAGTDLGPYRVESRLGSGGFGEAWKAFNATEGRHVVIKVVPRDIQRHQEEVEHLRESFQLIHALHHQNICPVYALTQDARVGLFLVMMYIDGVTLSKYRRQYLADHDEIPLEEVVRLLRPLGEALDYAHQRHVIHRDIKPDNIMIDKDVTPYLIDFGIAAQIKTSMTRISRQQFDTRGTAPYMAPEQWRGQGLDGRSDQYALALVAYELLSGRLPFESTDSDILRQCVIHEEPPFLDDRPDYVNRALQRALAKDRKHRFENCVTMIAALDDHAILPSDQTPIDAQLVEPVSGNSDSDFAAKHDETRSAMKIYRHWAKSAADRQPAGRFVECFGCSNESVQEALASAKARANRVADSMQGGRDPDPYSYGERPVREEIVKEYLHDQHTSVVMTRNGYGALIMNTPRTLFADIDYAEKSASLGGLFSSLFGKEEVSQDEQVIARIRDVVANDPSLGMRVYRTKNGFRCLLTSRTFDPRSDESHRLLQQLQSDPKYVQLCRVQACYRARVSPKPWRCGIANPPSRFPFDNHVVEQKYRQWQKLYEERTKPFSICAVIGDFGSSNVDPEAGMVMQLHDQLACNGDGQLC